MFKYGKTNFWSQDVALSREKINIPTWYWLCMNCWLKSATQTASGHEVCLNFWSTSFTSRNSRLVTPPAIHFPSGFSRQSSSDSFKLSSQYSIVLSRDLPDRHIIGSAPRRLAVSLVIGPVWCPEVINGQVMDRSDKFACRLVPDQITAGVYCRLMLTFHSIVMARVESNTGIPATI